MNHQPLNSDPDPLPLRVSFLVEVLRQFGAGMLVAGVFAVAVVRMYEDLERKNELLVSLVKEQTQAAQSVSENLRRLIEKIDK